MKVKVTSAFVREGKILKPGTTADIPTKEAAHLASRGKVTALEPDKSKGSQSKS